TLNLLGTYSSPGTLVIDNNANSTLNLGGTLTSATFGTFTRTGGIVNITGTITGNLTLNATTGSWNLVGGALQNGILTETAGASLVLTTSGGTLSNMTVNGDLDLSLVNGSVVTIQNGLVLNGSMLIGDAANTVASRVDFGFNQGPGVTLSGNATVVFGASTGNTIRT